MNIAKPNVVVLLDTVREKFSTARDSSRTVQGSYCAAGDQEMGIFAAGNNLYFQWNDERWNFKDLALVVRYKHDFSKKVTVFSIADVSIEYPAWWANDPAFDPSVPEHDEDEDFFAYVARLAQNEPLRQTLINAWDKQF